MPKNKRNYKLDDFSVDQPVAVHDGEFITRGVVTKKTKTRLTVEVPRSNGGEGTFTRQFYEAKYGALELGLPEYGGGHFTAHRVVPADDPMVPEMETRQAARHAAKRVKEAAKTFAGLGDRSVTPEAAVRLQQALQVYLDETSQLGVQLHG